MTRSRWWACIAVAWVVPLLWLVLVPLIGPSDGTVVSSPTAVVGEGRWEESLLVIDTYGDTPLNPGDQVLSVDGDAVPDLLATRDAASRQVGDVLTYRVRRPGPIDTIQQVEVTLTRFPLGSAVVENAHWAVLAGGLLVAGTVLLLRGAPRTIALATLGAGAAAGVGLSAHPMGVQAVDVTGAGPLWPFVVGEVVMVLGLGALVVAAASFPHPPRSLASPRGLVLLGVPYAACAVWLAAYAARQPEPARLQAMLDLTLPAVVATTVAVALAAATGPRRAPTYADQVALRLVVLAALAAVAVVLLLDAVPDAVRGSALVPWEVLALFLVPLVLACWVAAVLAYRLADIDATLRRSLLQGAVAAVVGIGFVVAANAVNLASGTSVGSMVIGGVVALMLLPVALLLSRLGSRLVYGDRAFPHRVVAELRRLEPSTAPEQALEEMLAMLSRSLRLSYASVRSNGSGTSEPLLVEVGEPRGNPTTVELEVAGRPTGRLEMEVSPLREPFGPRDRRLLEELGSQVGALVQALQGGRELQRTRERLVAAREEERRRLRRDLHDGLGPSLATHLMHLETARDLVQRDPDEAAELIGRLADDTESDIAEIRRLVDGLRPPALDQLGLVSALRQQADQHNHAIAMGSSAPSWTVMADDLGVLPAAVEVAAYRVAVEAVNNAIRHSHASTCQVSLRRSADALQLEISDDGTGLPEDRGAGVGIGSMRERAEELGGTCSVTPGPHGGTLVSAYLPLAPRGKDEVEPS